MKHGKFIVEQAGQSGGHCNCCGHETRTVWGYVSTDEAAIASYFIQWTRGQPEHYPNLDFLIGTWGDNEKDDRKLVSWVYNASVEQFMIIDGQSRPAAKSSLCAHAMTRDEVRADPDFLQLAKDVLDAAWLGDNRIEEVRGANDA
jgi:hypothetical protein